MQFNAYTTNKCNGRQHYMQVEEADHLQNLISAAHASNLDFYYALSPGLDIAYSNSKEVHNHLSLCCTY